MNAERADAENPAMTLQLTIDIPWRPPSSGIADYGGTRRVSDPVGE